MLQEAVMTRLAIAFAALSLATGTAAAAQEMPMPQVFRDSPFQKGQWTMQILEMNAKGAQQSGGMPVMTMCLDDLREMGRNQSGRREAERPNCKVKLLKDTATEAVMETTCPDSTSRATVTREGDKSYLMHAVGTNRGEPYSMKARYTFDSAQCTQSGVGMGMGGMNRNSPECQKAQAQLSSMNPGAMCANAGANRAMCEQNVQRMKSQLEALCR
jgi:hypothetical protein